MEEKPQKLTVVRILQVSNINNIAELQEVNDTLMPKPQEIALHSTQKITKNSFKTHQFFTKKLIQNFL